MSDAECAPAESTDSTDGDVSGAKPSGSTPLGNPWFLPVLLWGGVLYFGYDGWFNPETEWIKFNRYGFGFLLGGAVYYTLDTLRASPSLLPLLFWGYSVWFGYMGWLGGENAWFGESSASVMFNRSGTGVMLAAAIFTTARAALNSRRADSAPRP